jgi:hypothetical protein
MANILQKPQSEPVPYELMRQHSTSQLFERRKNVSEARVNSFSWGSRQKLTESRLISKDQISSHLRSKTPLLILLETVEENSDEKKEAKNSKHRAENNRCLFRVVVLFF